MDKVEKNSSRIDKTPQKVLKSKKRDTESSAKKSERESKVIEDIKEKVVQKSDTEKIRRKLLGLTKKPKSLDPIKINSHNEVEMSKNDLEPVAEPPQSLKKVKPKVSTDQLETKSKIQKPLVKNPSKKNVESGGEKAKAKLYPKLPAIEKKPDSKSENHLDSVPMSDKKVAKRVQMVGSERKSSKLTSQEKLEKSFKSIDDDFDLLDRPRYKVDEKRMSAKLKSQSESNLLNRIPRKSKKLSTNGAIEGKFSRCYQNHNWPNPQFIKNLVCLMTFFTELSQFVKSKNFIHDKLNY